MHRTRRLESDKSAACCRGWEGPLGGPCSACERGKYKPGAGAGLCKVCSPGEYQYSTTQGECALCPSGSFQPLNGSSTCTSCPSGKAGTVTNATSEMEACVEHCIPGTYSAASTIAAIEIYQSALPTACRLCPLHTYAYRPMTGPQCTICQPHSSSPTGSNNATNCTCNRCYSPPRHHLLFTFYKSSQLPPTPILFHVPTPLRSITSCPTPFPLHLPN